MSFTPLVDAWHESEQTRSRLRPGRRWYRMEKELGDGYGLADMTRNRHHWRWREAPDETLPIHELWARDDSRDRRDDGTESVSVDGWDDEFTDASERDEAAQDTTHEDTGSARGDSPRPPGAVWDELRGHVDQARESVDAAADAAADARPDGDSDGEPHGGRLHDAEMHEAAADGDGE